MTKSYQELERKGIDRKDEKRVLDFFKKEKNAFSKNIKKIIIMQIENIININKIL